MSASSSSSVASLFSASTEELLIARHFMNAQPALAAAPTSNNDDDADDDDDDADEEDESSRFISASLSLSRSLSQSSSSSSSSDESTTTRRNITKIKKPAPPKSSSTTSQTKRGKYDDDEPIQGEPHLMGSAHNRIHDEGVHLSNAVLNAAAGSSEGGTDLSGEPVPVTLTAHNPFKRKWEDVDEEAHAASDDEVCVDCELAQTEKEIEANPFVERYRSHFIDNYAFTDPQHLARQTQRKYNEKVRKNTDKKRVYLCRKIVEHHEEHILQPQIVYGAELRHLNFALKCMRENEVYKKDQEGNVIVDGSKMRLYLQIMNQRNALLERVGGKSKPSGSSAATTGGGGFAKT